MSNTSAPRVTKFTNGLLLRNGSLVEADLWVDSHTGQVMSSQASFYSEHLVADQIIDLQGKIVSPGFLDVQLNGAHGFDFSVPCPDYAEKFQETARKLIKSGVTSYLPTVTSQKAEVYHSVLPYLGPSGQAKDPADGAESLGAHVEGPFLSPAKNGIHSPEVLIKAESFADLEECYGASNLSQIKKITAAPELGNMTALIPELVEHNIVYSIGHSDATFEQAQAAISAGATMVTHMFNAMRPFGHRDPGIFGLLGQSPLSSPTHSRPSTPRSSRPASPSSSQCSSPTRSRKTNPRSAPSSGSSFSDLSTSSASLKPFFGVIADGIHLHPSSVQIAHAAHPDGCILVTDAMKLAGCPDGTYEWTNGEKIIKQGSVLRLEKNGRIAGSAVTLIECINNFRHFTGCDPAAALECVTTNPARMLGPEVTATKGALEPGMDADLVILSDDAEAASFTVEQVWKFGVRVA